MPSTQEVQTFVSANGNVPVPWRYPNELETTIVLRSGDSLLLRPIRSDDDEKLVDFHRHLSFDSIYRRYFSAHPALSAEEIRHFTNVDYVNRFAFVVEDDDQLLAVGRYDRLPEAETAEVAFVVRDDYQHLGLGHRLLAVLAETAWRRGIAVFTAETLLSNRDMISVFRHSGFPVTSQFIDGDVAVRFPIEPARERKSRTRANRLSTP
jgi:GNAT superfamily N-acetyltransferase